MNHEYKRPESVLIIVCDQQKHVLLLRRRRPDYFWQSPAGSLRWDEEPHTAAVRELREETGLSTAGHMTDCKMVNRFIIYPMWRDRYAPGVIENTEYVFYFEHDEQCVITLDTNEHIEYQWLDCMRSLRKITSYTNREAVRRYIAKMP